MKKKILMLAAFVSMQMYGSHGIGEGVIQKNFVTSNVKPPVLPKPKKLRSNSDRPKSVELHKNEPAIKPKPVSRAKSMSDFQLSNKSLSEYYNENPKESFKKYFDETSAQPKIDEQTLLNQQDSSVNTIVALPISLEHTNIVVTQPNPSRLSTFKTSVSNRLKTGGISISEGVGQIQSGLSSAGKGISKGASKIANIFRRKTKEPIPEQSIQNDYFIVENPTHNSESVASANEVKPKVVDSMPAALNKGSSAFPAKKDASELSFQEKIKNLQNASTQYTPQPKSAASSQPQSKPGLFRKLYNKLTRANNIEA